jgi:hypothetical protein
MTTPQLDPVRFHYLAAEYRGLAKARSTGKEKAELLDLAARLTALAELDLWKPHLRKTPQAQRPRRRMFKFGLRPPDIDPAIKVPTPNAGKTPVIPPPGKDQKVQPK